MELTGVKKILIIRLRSLGDILLCTPAIRALREHYPQAYLTLLVEERFQELLTHNPLLNEVMVDKSQELKGSSLSIRLKEQLNFIFSLRKQRFDLVVDFHGGPRSALYTFISGARYRLGYKYQGRTYAYNIKADPGPADRHTVEHQLDLVRTIGADTKNRELLLVVGQAEREQAKKILEEKGIGEGDLLVAIYPGARWVFKTWISEGFARVGDELADKFGAKLIMVGASPDWTKIKSILSLMKSRPIVLVDLRLKQLAAVLERCSLFVGNDSGPMHMAAAMGTPIVALFGPSDYRRWRPWGEGHLVVRGVLPCSPCDQRGCPRGEDNCMRQIPVEEVLAAAKRQLALLKVQRPFS